MADIWEAYKFLNDSLALGISEDDLRRREIEFKQLFAAKNRLAVIVGNFKPEDWEFFAELVPPDAARRRERENTPKP